ncbi:MAG TPA: DUF6775 family putative metallopeptidase [Nitrososphaera sp.]|nr:DUF6775 family putative metallopeptidase [Nitrososphaera sp.]
MDPHNVHIYRNDSVPNLDTSFIAAEGSKIFQSCSFDIRNPFEAYWKVDYFHELCQNARVFDSKQPFERQSKIAGDDSELYDGFVLQRLLCSMISDDELNSQHIHLILTEKLTCTFDEEDWRYHARSVICGVPSMISTSGIVEAPARPKEYYNLARSGSVDPQLLKEFEGRFIEYGDNRLTIAVLVYLAQTIFFFITDGEPFCKDQKCILFNAHWQEELLQNLQNPAFCGMHDELLKKFNSRR